MTPRSLALVLSAFAATACGGLATRSSYGQDSGTTASNTGITQPTQTSFTAADVTTAQGSCDDSLQESPSYTTVGEYRAQLVGAWWLCGGPPPAGPIVITGDGRWLNLVSDGNGGLVLGTRAADRSTYEIDTVFDGQPILDGGPGQVLGAETTVIVAGKDGEQTQFLVDPMLGPTRLDVWLWSEPYSGNGWMYVQLGGR